MGNPFPPSASARTWWILREACQPVSRDYNAVVRAKVIRVKEVFRALTLAVLATPLAAAQEVPPGGDFTATATMTTKQGTRSLAFTVSVSRPRSVADAIPLKQILETGGQQALLNAIRGGPGGQFRLGAIQYPIDLVVAEAISDGSRYVVVTARSLRVEEVNEGRESLDHPFTVIAFDVPEFGTGQGRICPQAALWVDSDGHVQVEQYDGEPGTLKDVRRVK